MNNLITLLFLLLIICINMLSIQPGDAVLIIGVTTKKTIKTCKTKVKMMC